jgi:hypothetical protein
MDRFHIYIGGAKEGIVDAFLFPIQLSKDFLLLLRKVSLVHTSTIFARL